MSGGVNVRAQVDSRCFMVAHTKVWLALLLLASLVACGPREFRGRSASDEARSEEDTTGQREGDFSRPMTISDEDDEGFDETDDSSEEWYSSDEEGEE
jgi:hypothetical protein